MQVPSLAGELRSHVPWGKSTCATREAHGLQLLSTCAQEPMLCNREEAGATQGGHSETKTKTKQKLRRKEMH